MKPTAKEALLSWSRWRSGNAPDFSEAISQADSLSAKTLVVLLLAHQYEHWKNGDRIPAEDYLDRHLVLQTDDEAACDLVYGEFVLREMLGESPVFQDYLDRFPRLADDLKQLVKFERFTGALPWFPMSVVESEGNAEKPSLLAKDHSASAIPDYDLVCRIGSGAFGQVWLARNRHDHGYCAVKIIVSHADIELDGVRLYRACASDHPFLVPIKHVGEVEGLYYYVMPLADDANGTSLPGTPELYVPMTLKRQMVERTSQPPLEEVIAITRDLLKAIAHLHAHGVRHCDVKLENVMRLEGVWRLGDIGLAHRGESSAGNRGTQAYWPPETTRPICTRSARRFSSIRPAGRCRNPRTILGKASSLPATIAARECSRRFSPEPANPTPLNVTRPPRRCFMTSTGSARGASEDVPSWSRSHCFFLSRPL